MSLFLFLLVSALAVASACDFFLTYLFTVLNLSIILETVFSSVCLNSKEPFLIFSSLIFFKL